MECFSDLEMIDDSSDIISCPQVDMSFAPIDDGKSHFVVFYCIRI